MATSGSINFTQNRNQILTDALYKIAVLSPGESLEASDLNLANNQLNRMIKSWQRRGINMWVRSTGYLFTQRGQSEYSITTDGITHATDSYFRTTLTADVDPAIIATTIDVASSADFTAGDNIGIVLDDNTTEWFIINDIPSATSILLDGGVTSIASSGASVFGFTDELLRPYRIMEANRRDVVSLIETPLSNLSYSEYFSLTNKNQLGTPISFNYIHDVGDAILRLYLTPENADYIISFVYARTLHDMDENTDNLDFPQEWLEAIIINLGVKLCPYYGKNSGEVYKNLTDEAKNELDLMIEADNEQGSVMIVPNMTGVG